MGCYHPDAVERRPRAPASAGAIFTGFSREAASPLADAHCLTTLVLLLMGVQGRCWAGETLSPAALIPCAAVLVMGWGLYIFSVGIQHRVSFEIETVGILLSGMGINLLASFDLEGVTTQLAAMLLGVFLFSFLLWFMGDMDRVAKCRLWIGLGALALLGATLVFGTGAYGSTNWIRIGPPSRAAL